MADNPYDRPILVTVIAILYALGALILIIGGVGMAIGGESIIDEIIAEDPEMSFLEGMGMAFGVAVLIVGLVIAVVSYGFLKGWSVMWYLGLILAVLGAISSLISIAFGQFGAVFSLAIAVIIVLYLFKDNVKLFFLKSS